MPQLEPKEVRYEPVPRPEDVAQWMRVAYTEGLKDGAVLALESLLTQAH